MVACGMGAENCHESTLKDEELKGKRREEGGCVFGEGEECVCQHRLS